MRELFRQERFGHTYNQRIPQKIQIWDMDAMVPMVESVRYEVYTAYEPNCQWSLFQ